MQFHEISNGDARLHVVDQPGHGVPVVIVHGLAGSSAEFAPTAAALGGHRVLRIDARGHGRSTRFPADVSRAAHVSDVVAVIEHLVGRPVALIGQSMGGHTALLVAAERPELVERLVLLEAGVGGDGDSSSRSAMSDFLHSWPTPFRSEDEARAFLGESALAAAWVADLEMRRGGLWPRFDPDVMVQTIAHVDAATRWDAWERVMVPTLAVFASGGMFDERAKRALIARGHDVLRADIDGSHDAHLDAFDDWMRVVEPFLHLP